MNKPQILFVEDDTAGGNLIATTLETQNYQFHRAKPGAGALMDALSYRPDVMLLDLGLPDMDGIEIIKKIRSWSNLPIIVVSARGEDADKVVALDAGADDYLTKPFSVEELLALRKQSPDGVPRCPRCGTIVKPDVVLYEEPLDDGTVTAAVRAIASADLLVIAGTSLAVYPAAGLIDYFSGDHLAIINRTPTPRDAHADLCIATNVGKVLGY